MSRELAELQQKHDSIGLTAEEKAKMRRLQAQEANTSRVKARQATKKSDDAA